MKKLLVLLTATLSMMAVTSCDKNEQDEPVQVNAANLKGTWEGGVERDSAQGYPQKWRIQFDGEDYTTWHTYLTLGSEDDEVQGLKTVGKKDKGNWTYADGVLKLIPNEQYTSYYQVINPDQSFGGYVYSEYDEETMEAAEWYRTPIYRHVHISRWSVVSLTKTALTVKIETDTFVLQKK